MLDSISSAEEAFFYARPYAAKLYRKLREWIRENLTEAELRVQKTQITFVNPLVFAAVSFLSPLSRRSMPDDYITLTLGFPELVDPDYFTAFTEACKGRWTEHKVIAIEEEEDERLFALLERSYEFSREKRRRRG